MGEKGAVHLDVYYYHLLLLLLLDRAILISDEMKLYQSGLLLQIII